MSLYRLVQVIGLSFLSFMSLNAFSEDGRFKEGVHYQVLPIEKSTSPKVTKFFSFYCGGCYAFDPYVQTLERDLPEGVVLQKVHVDFVRGASPEILNVMGRGALLAKQLDVGHAYDNYIFRQIHQSRQIIRGEEDIVLALIAAGIEKEVAMKGLSGFSVKAQHNNGKALQQSLAAGRHLKGVPTLIVNDRFRIEHSKLDQGNFQRELADLTRYLLAL